ncbi:predicted protein [Naegleria gruberi]|uniref:Predicted protein n=1 Tax=Naegleria gruberi TaxID=5762 RepID=D2V7Q7_NAEGR|nr:uncharacterized protein NAEGRDRAFT_64891 [Naegleria gruberi]EFC46915.1 predicted protein [Naegleria gruberi]|eukprot:XP_002679659.1 predicted protein [Naegleria gruberi strain NEG-M]
MQKRETLTSLPPELFFSILSYLDNWQEKIQFCTQFTRAKERNWRETLRGMIYEKKTHELDFIVNVLPQKLFVQRSRWNVKKEQPMPYFAKLVDLLKFVKSKRRHDIMFTKKYGNRKYSLLGSVLISFKKYTKKDNVEEVNEILLPFINYYLEEGFEYYGNYSFITNESNFVALLTMVELGCLDTVTDILTNKIGEFKFNDRNAQSLLVRFMKSLVPLEVLKKCLIETRIITASLLVSPKELYRNRYISHCIVFINAKMDYTNWEYFKNLIDLISDLILEACTKEELENNNHRTNMLQLFGKKTKTADSSFEYSSIDFLAETITKSEKPTSNKMKFLYHVENRVRVSIVPRYKNLAEYYAKRWI